ncbi:hypothetical protein EYZ11_007486 [Aspergillus tanneri]|uniref:Xylanolytic transcriptional activator regulatory domain-containing protein n=1 Tax=Aspergillus tanneri TaxID=1220188 RepID=A0A4S3JD82_9EURO|nr:hypothetical protein EYZ11_007486 [Aspergillus tanneri]
MELFDASVVQTLRVLLEEGPSRFMSRFSHTPKSLIVAGYLGWVAFQCLLYAQLPGRICQGQTTPAGYLLGYRANGLFAFGISILVAINLSVGKFVDPTIIAVEWESLLLVGNVYGFLLCILFYVKANVWPSHPEDRKFTGSIFYDLYMGVELNPRFGRLWDMKLFHIGRMGMMSWIMVDLSFTAYQHRLHGYVTPSILIVDVLHLLYVADFFFREDRYLRTIDIEHDHFGFYFAWGSAAFLPAVYTLQTQFLARNPVQLHPAMAAIILVAGLGGYTIYCHANEQKYRVRLTRGNCMIAGEKPKIIKCSYETTNGVKHESLLLCSGTNHPRPAAEPSLMPAHLGWWGYVRHANYLGDLILSYAMCAACGVTHLLPWTYAIFMTILLTHRCIRDEKRCLAKYGKLWESYCDQNTRKRNSENPVTYVMGRRKLKCDRALPCGQCIKSKTPDRSVATTSPDQAHKSSSRTSSVHGGLYIFDSKHHRVTKPKGRPDELHELRHRVQMLEQGLSRAGPVQTPESLGHDADSPLRVSCDAQYLGENVKHLPQSACFRGKNGKSRFCGRSYWGFDEVKTVMRGCRDKFKSKDSEYTRMKKLKGEVWSRERQDHQRAYREKAFTMEKMIPDRRVADELLNLYLSTFETTYRILHVPTFRKQYEMFWSSSEKTDMIFVAKLLALMAASSCFFGPTTRLNENDTLHRSASAWIISVQSWVASSYVSSTITLDMLQIQCLLLIARQSDATDGDVVWISSGSLIRSAMTMGLHRSPSMYERMTPFWAEMRRRLWATILEFDLESSLDGGMAPSIDLDEFDCEPPSNYDDADLTEDMTEDVAPKDAVIPTRNSFQIFLSRSLPLRVRIAKSINRRKFGLSYDEALRLGEQLGDYMNEALALYPDSGPTGNLSFARSFLLFLMRRFMLLLHRPFALSVSLSPKFSFSRKICLESSLEMLSQLDVPTVSLPEVQGCPHLGQLAGGMFRDEFLHAAISVCVELALQSGEFSGVNRLPGQSSSVSTLDDLVRSQQGVLLRTVEHTLDTLGSRITTSGKGCKAFFFLAMTLSSVKARMNAKDVRQEVEQAAMRAIRDCEQILQGASWSDIQGRSEMPMLTPSLETTSETPLDPASFAPADLSDLSPLGFANLFDTADYELPDIWANDFFSSF